MLSPVSVLWLCLLFLFYNFTDARPPCQTGGRSVYGTYDTYSTYQVFCGSGLTSKKPVLSSVFGVFAPVFSSCFGTQLSHVQYTIIARVVYKIRTVSTQRLHVLLWLYVYAYNAFTVFGYCVAFYKLFSFPIIKYGRRIVPYTSFFGFGGVWLSGCLKYLFK